MAASKDSPTPQSPRETLGLKPRRDEAVGAPQTDKLQALEDLLGHRFGDRSLMLRALTHGSHANAAKGTYERLEFLGDRVLGLVIAEVLWRRFPKEDEGLLSRRLVDLVRKETLAQIGLELGIDRFIRVSRAEESNGGRKNPSLVCDVVEALIAALYVDGGLAAATAFIDRHWRPFVDQERKPPRDAKTALQEWAQSQGKPLPVYSEIERSGPSHSPEFVMQAQVLGLPPSRGSGNSKRRAEQAAAKALLAQHAPNIPTLDP